MMRRQIFMWMGLIVLFFVFGFGREVFAIDRYTVKNGDNLARISKKLGVSIRALKEANNLQSDALKIRQVLIVPKTQKTKIAKSKKPTPVTAASYVVKKGDTLAAIARNTGISTSDLAAMNNIRNNRLRIGQRLVLSDPESMEDAEEESADGAERERSVALRDVEELEEDDGAPLDTRESAKADDEGETDFLGKWESPNEPQLLAKVAMGFLGAPYRLGGSSVRGLDCSAFVKKIYAFFDINLPRTAREQARIGKSIDRNELEVGDLVFFNTRRRAFGHVGVYIGNNEFVHASSGRTKAVKVDTLDKPYYDKRFVKAVRLKALGDED